MTSEQPHPDQRPVLGVVGATGAVGRVVVQVLAMRAHHWSRVRLAAGHEDVGSTVAMGGEEVVVEPLTEEFFDDLDVAIFDIPPHIAREWVEKLHVRTPGIDALCLNLSGGNQQKVVLAKWLNARSRILILDHPTRGLDVGAKEEVYELVRAVTAEGMAVILTSDTLEETIGLSHTVLVMRDGVITHRTDASPGRKPQQVELIEHMV